MTESCEMYLKQILILKNEYGNVKAIDIAKNMGFSKPSVSNALSSLKDKNFIKVSNGYIELTDKGLIIANEVFEKFEIIKRFLINSLKMNVEDAKINACRIEHIITDSCYREMIDYLKEENNVRT
jgi:Mn-dependent transcriptional regulator